PLTSCSSLHVTESKCNFSIIRHPRIAIEVEVERVDKLLCLGKVSGKSVRNCHFHFHLGRRENRNSIDLGSSITRISCWKSCRINWSYTTLGCWHKKCKSLLHSIAGCHELLHLISKFSNIDSLVSHATTINWTGTMVCGRCGLLLLLLLLVITFYCVSTIYCVS